MTSPADRLESLGVTIPSPSAPAANYVPFVRVGDMLHISGQIPFIEGFDKTTGKLGADASMEVGIEAARRCAINIIAQAQVALDGDLERIVRFVKLGGFVNCTPDFTDHPKVINGASDFLVSVFGERGHHARFAVGAASLPLGIPVEIDAIIAVR